MRIAVVIPVRNDAQRLADCLVALERQTRPADEIVVVDNGSTDGSAAVAAAHGARVVPARVAGIPGATATGFDHARGDVVARLDADSVPAADWLERIEAAFAADPSLAAVSGAATFYGGTPIVRFLGRLSLTLGYFRLIAGVIGHAPLYGSNFAVRTEVWRRMRGAVHRDRADVHDDLDISLQLPAGAEVRYDPGLEVAVSSRSFLRPGGTRRQIGMTARTFLVTGRERGLLRLRLTWFLADQERAAQRDRELWRLGALERGAAERIWGRWARRSPASRSGRVASPPEPEQLDAGSHR